MADVLITGGAGFIGSHIVRNLIQKGHHPIIFDSFVKYTFSPDKKRGIVLPETLAEKRIETIKDKITIVKLDLNQSGAFGKALDDYRPYAVIHLAGIPLANVANIAPQMAIDNNLMATLAVLNAIKDRDFIQRFIYTSSSMVYGNFIRPLADEEHPTNPICNYGTTKLAGEVLTKGMSNRYEFEHTIIRPSAVYGPTDYNHRVVQIFLEKAMKGETLFLQGGGESRLDFTFVEDLAEGFVLALKSKNAINQTFNLTRGESRTLGELTGTISQHIPNVKTEIVPQEMKRPERGTLDISKARKLLGFNPQYSLEKGIAKYISHIKEYGL